MPSDHSRIETVARTGASVLRTAVAWLVSAFVASIALLSQSARTVWRATRSTTTRLGDWSRRVATGPVRRTLAGPVRVGLLGRRADVSLLVVVLAPAVAVATAAWLGSSVGFETLERWIRGTWYGTDPHVGVFLGCAFLLGIGAVSAALNSGLLPTTLLVAAPVFGAAATRYGTAVTRGGDTIVVSLPDAAGVATLLAVAVGVPLAVCSFLLGIAVRHVVDALRGQSSRSSPAEGACTGRRSS
ncbi:MAG: hypothetical protein ABEH56_05575 [Salinirussus sp.]